MTLGSAIGPQCISCRRRRVKCDSTIPECKRCNKDDLECPGYIRVREWNGESRSSSRRKATRSALPDRSKPEEESDQQVVPVTKSQNSYDDPLVHCIPSWLLQNERECFVLVDSLDYFNRHMLPSVIPAHPPFKRKEMHVPYWDSMPTILRNVFIAIARTSQAWKAYSDPMESHDLCRYRGLVLTELKEYLQHAESDTYGIVISSVISMMMLDLQSSAYGSWTYHFKAARRLISMRGGFSKCYVDVPAIRSLLINYMVVDILYTTMNKIEVFDSEWMDFYRQYLTFIPLWEESIITNARPCPGPILQAVLRTTALRTRKPKTPSQSEEVDKCVAGILIDIEKFDVEAWAYMVTSYGQPRPTKAVDCPNPANLRGWSALAICYQKAAMLYLLASTTPGCLEHTLLKCYEANEVLEEQIHFLLDISSHNQDDAVETQLWKFIEWPMVVSAYVRVGKDIGTEGVEGHIERLRKTGIGMGSRPLMDFSVLMEVIKIKKSEGDGKMWTWDAGFDSISTPMWPWPAL